MKIAICTPMIDPPNRIYLQSLVGLAIPAGWQWAHLMVERQPVDVARNTLTERVLENGFDWVLWLDQDAEVHPGTLLRLLSWGVPVVGALAFNRRPPIMPTVYRGEDEEKPGAFWMQVADVRDWIHAHRELWVRGAVLLEPRPEDALYQVDFTGCHCLLVRRDVFEGIAANGAEWFRRDESQGRYVGEDRWFCERAREAGFPVYVDLSVVAGHLPGEQSIGCMDFLVWDNVADYTKGHYELAFRERVGTY